MSKGGPSVSNICNSGCCNVQAQAAEMSAGAQPVIIRNTGGGGSRDVHLENFSISNGGQELIEVQPNFLLQMCLELCARLHQARSAAMS